MSKEIAINVVSLSKIFKLYKSRRDRIKELIHPGKKNYHQNHDALKNVSFSIERGEVLGIIGQNGSGKSTLLKILASVVTPTSGMYQCNGRVTALLELGGGFNADLTGIENIKFLGSIQGYSKHEMPDLISRILEFADIGQYAGQPVRSYSSGMYMRLAFSISININPDILIVDEALAVGDIRFQQKCFRKIREFKDAGKTILLCSHSLTAIQEFCSQAIWLHEGEIKEQGDPIFVTDCYNAYMTSKQLVTIKKNNGSLQTEMILPIAENDLPKPFREIAWPDLSICETFGTGGCHIQSATIVSSETNKNIRQIKGGENLSVLLYLKADQKIINPSVHLLLNGQFGSSVFKISSHAYQKKLEFHVDKPTVVMIHFTFPMIGNGHYSFSLGVVSILENKEQFHHYIHDALLIEVSNPDIKYKMGTQLVLEKATIESFID